MVIKRPTIWNHRIRKVEGPKGLQIDHRVTRLLKWSFQNSWRKNKPISPHARKCQTSRQQTKRIRIRLWVAWIRRARKLSKMIMLPYSKIIRMNMMSKTQVLTKKRKTKVVQKRRKRKRSWTTHPKKRFQAMRVPKIQVIATTEGLISLLKYRLFKNQVPKRWKEALKSNKMKTRHLRMKSMKVLTRTMRMVNLHLTMTMSNHLLKVKNKVIHRLLVIKKPNLL